MPKAWVIIVRCRVTSNSVTSIQCFAQEHFKVSTQQQSRDDTLLHTSI